MKRAYLKPEISIENFLLSDRIANCTSADPAFSNGCSIEVASNVLQGFQALGLFNSGMSCSKEASGKFDLNGDGNVDVCYHTSSGTITGLDNVFNS